MGRWAGVWCADVGWQTMQRRQTNAIAVSARAQAKICAQLDSALLTDDEMEAYNAKWASLPDPPHTES